jgi:hypothetical protein
MKNLFSYAIIGFTLISNFAIISYLFYENKSLREQPPVMVSQNYTTKNYSDRPEWQIFGLEDVEFFREQGKTDGKIEAILLMSNQLEPVSQEQADKVLQIAENKSGDLHKNPQFISLLCQAAFHKGLAAGEENWREQIDQEYTKGYHAAIDDFTCPETGQFKTPPKDNLKDLPIKK